MGEREGGDVITWFFKERSFYKMVSRVWYSLRWLFFMVFKILVVFGLVDLLVIIEGIGVFGV